MKLCRFDKGSVRDRFGLVRDGVVLDVSDVLGSLGTCGYPYPNHDAMIAALPELMPLIERVAQEGTTGNHALADVTLRSPVANPGKLVAAPVNYAKHLEEVRQQSELHHHNAAHVRQIREIGLFLKSTSSLVGPSDRIVVGKPERRNDHEIELAVVIGKTAKDVSAADALAHVAGYCIGLDMTVRGSEDRSFRKSLDTYSVLGPWLVTADELPDPSCLDFELTVNGETRQKANTRDLVLSVPDLIEFASGFYTLHPGDVIFTGTPEGVAPVVAGDLLHASIVGIGEFSMHVA